MNSFACVIVAIGAGVLMLLTGLGYFGSFAHIIIATGAGILMLLTGLGYLYHPDAFQPSWLWLAFGVVSGLISMGNIFMYHLARKHE